MKWDPIKRGWVSCWYKRNVDIVYGAVAFVVMISMFLFWIVSHAK